MGQVEGSVPYLASENGSDLVISVPHARARLTIAGDASVSQDVGASLQAQFSQILEAHPFTDSPVSSRLYPYAGSLCTA
jgi:hypothetical protein